MLALLAVKCVVLVQAAADEAHGSAVAQNETSASAQARGPAPGSADMAHATSIASAPAASSASSPSVMPVSEAERSVLLDLRHRRDELDARARALDQRAADLAAADRRLGDRVHQLDALQARLEALETAREQHGAENWAGLVKIYEAMKPRDAAAIFDALDMQVLLQVIDRMQARRVAPILAAMQPDRARLATQLLAEMRTREVTPAANDATSPSTPQNPIPKG